MLRPDTVTVVVPVLDDADQLRRCLEAVARQTRLPDEVVVVDNGSSDDSAAVASQAGARVLHEPVRAIAAAASRGYDAATSTLIARLDSDSCPGPDWLERALRHFDDDRVVAVTGPGEFRGLGRLERAFWHVAYMRAYFALMTAALWRPPLFGSNLVIRRRAWEAVRSRVHRYDAEVHDDVDLSVQLDPAWPVVLDRSLVMSVSGDPVRDLPGLLVRTRKALRTLALGGFRILPVVRAVRRWSAGPRRVPGAEVDRSRRSDVIEPLEEVPAS
ncbi:glycosyltransferase family 2 protein [Curtobacterium sp. A7_M15]|uniref:glycosyltransferase family 2 protein n=1 Tax=Curtobacterium sp. A7_M15 TaxID=3065241 RepID=UPI002737EC55|nr:glycosyltransferase family 2 protein [Curtobacterium sp. A7_M15]MDP4334552.1 glycosyltransferase family 2 protein [Curtobacterium sp. A7_M15]